jgi:hypothetical protein
MKLEMIIAKHRGAPNGSFAKAMEVLPREDPLCP